MLFIFIMILVIAMNMVIIMIAMVTARILFMARRQGPWSGLAETEMQVNIVGTGRADLVAETKAVEKQFPGKFYYAGYGLTRLL